MIQNASIMAVGLVLLSSAQGFMGPMFVIWYGIALSVYGMGHLEPLGNLQAR